MAVVDKRGVLLCNPNSCRASDVVRNVILPLQQEGVSFEQWTTNSPNSEDNIDDLTGLLRAGDRIIVASGDGVASQLANAAMRSGLDDIEIGVLGYGGFNDMATAFTGSNNPMELFDTRAKISDVYPLEVHVNNELYRYGVMYSSMGWAALTSTIMDDPDLREKVQNRKFKIPTTLFAVVKNYCLKKKIPLPDFIREGYENEDHTGVTDIVHINGPNTSKLI